MSLKEQSPNDTKIKLYVVKSNHEMPVATDSSPYVAIDITDQVLKETDGFDLGSIRGISYQTEHTCDQEAFSRQYNLCRNLEFEINSLLDAVLVNEKQKEATKRIAKEKIWTCFDNARHNFEFVKDCCKE